MSGLFVGLALIAASLGAMVGSIRNRDERQQWLLMAFCTAVGYIGAQLVSLWLSLKLVMP